MRRREVIFGAAGLAALAGKAMAADDLKAIAAEAWTYCVPLIETAAQRAGVMPNNLLHRRALADFRSRGVTTPNNDTLYSVAHLDLANGPVTLTLPKSGERYLSLHLMDAYTNSFRILGTRTTGPDGGVFTLVGPGSKSGGAARTIVSPTRHVWALGRIVVDGTEDMAGAQAVQSGLKVAGPAAAPAPAFARRQAAWADYFAAADKLMVLDPPPAADAPFLARIAALGIGKGAFDASKFPAADATAIAAGVEQARSAPRVMPTSAQPGGGGQVGDFGTNYALRAQTAITGLAALPPIEAMYFRLTPPPGGFDGSKPARLHFAAGQLPPVKAFWSLSMYQPTPEGQMFFVENPLGRYAIGDRTKGLVKNSDGSLDIWLGAADPGGAKSANWLPAPKGAYVPTLRAYLPKPELLDGRWKPPAVTPA